MSVSCLRYSDNSLFLHTPAILYLMNFSGIFGHIISTTGFVLAFLIFPHDTPANIPQAKITPVATPTNIVNVPSYVATEHYTYAGDTVALSLVIPKSGGNVSGTISGDCTGTVSGTYDGGDKGKLNGKVQATCYVYLVSIPVTGTYSGIVDTQDKKINVTVDVTADGFEKSQQVSLQLH